MRCKQNISAVLCGWEFAEAEPAWNEVQTELASRQFFFPRPCPIFQLNLIITNNNSLAFNPFHIRRTFAYGIELGQLIIISTPFFWICLLCGKILPIRHALVGNNWNHIFSFVLTKMHNRVILDDFSHGSFTFKVTNDSRIVVIIHLGFIVINCFYHFLVTLHVNLLRWSGWWRSRCRHINKLLFTPFREKNFKRNRRRMETFCALKKTRSGWDAMLIDS